jgi:hypothetical protein
MVTMTNIATSYTTMFSDGKRFLYPVATLGTVLRSESSRNFPDSSTSLCSFVFEYANECSPRCVTDGFGKVMIFDQSFNIQVFYGYFIKLTNQLKTRFVKEITALILYLQMFLTKQTHSLSTIRAAQLLLTDLALLNLQLALCFAKITRILNYFASRKRGEVFQTHINAKRFARLRKESRLVFFHRKNDKPTVNLSLDGAAFYLAFDRTRKPQATRANLGESQLVTFQSESGLRIGKRVIAALAFKSWKACFFITLQTTLKEGVIGSRHSPKNILRDLRIQASQVFPYLSNLFQLIGLVIVVDGLPGLPVGVASFLKRGVVEFTANLQGRFKLLRQFHCRFQFEFIGLHQTCYNISRFYTKSSIALRRWQIHPSPERDGLLYRN